MLRSGRITDEQVKLVSKLQQSFLLFVRTFFPLLNAKPFEISNPIEREPHAVLISRLLTQLFRGELQTTNAIINIAPGSGKCIDAQTKILTIDGVKTANGVTVGEQVYSWDGATWVKRYVTAKEESHQECLQIITDSGRRLICSYRHRWLTPSGYIEACQLAPGDELMILNAKLEENDTAGLLAVLAQLMEQYGHFNVEETVHHFLVPTYDMAETVQYFLSMLGYVSRIESHFPEFKVELHFESFKDFVSDIHRLAKEERHPIEHISLHKFIKYQVSYRSDFEEKPYHWDRIIQVNPLPGKRKLIDLQVEETENFIANGVVSHNSTLMAYWAAWCMSQYPDSNFLYISYSKRLATTQTHTIKKIMSLPQYRELFMIDIATDTKAKDHFQTNHNGEVAAFGAAGSITGMNAGLPTERDRFGGAIILDDAHKPDEVHSDVMREKVITNYRETIKTRKRNPHVPLVFIGQRLHEDDLGGYLADGRDGEEWEKLIIESVDKRDRSFYPEVYPIEKLHKLQQYEPYVFASQHQQNPIPAGGALFKSHWFAILDNEPKFIATFITADTAETDKTYNDATVFSFWGVYKLEGQELGLHWIDCKELRVEPKDLQYEFESFYQACTVHKTRPEFAAIEKKSTGATLVSVLDSLRGLRIKPIERTRKSGSKTQRFLACQPHVAAQKVSFTEGAFHQKMCIDHMTKITASDTHRWDDIADTLSDAIYLIYELNTFDRRQEVEVNYIPARERSMLR